LIGFGTLLIVRGLGERFVKVANRFCEARAEGPALGLGAARLGSFVGLMFRVPKVLLALVIAVLLGDLTAGVY
jgi:hypothetical protein